MPRLLRRRAIALEADYGAEGTDRRSFLRSSGRAAAIAAVPSAAVAIATTDDAEAAKASPPATAIKDPTKHAPNQPTMAYIQDAKRGDVVIMKGGTQRTVRDRELVRRLTVKPKKRKVVRRRKRKHTPKSTHKKGN